MILNQLAIFNDKELQQARLTLRSFSLMGDNVRKQLTKACEDYQFLVDCLPSSRGLTRQVILFLLSSESCTFEGIKEFLGKLELWIMVVEDEVEQRLYADVIRVDTHLWGTNETLALRGTLIDILLELEDRRENTPIDTKIPMHLQGDYPDYSTFMMEYGSEFDKPDSAFNKVPYLKGEIPDPFSSYMDEWGIPED